MISTTPRACIRATPNAHCKCIGIDHAHEVARAPPVQQARQLHIQCTPQQLPRLQPTANAQLHCKPPRPTTTTNTPTQLPDHNEFANTKPRSDTCANCRWSSPSPTQSSMMGVSGWAAQCHANPGTMPHPMPNHSCCEVRQHTTTTHANPWPRGCAHRGRVSLPVASTHTSAYHMGERNMPSVGGSEPLQG